MSITYIAYALPLAAYDRAWINGKPDNPRMDCRE